MPLIKKPNLTAEKEQLRIRIEKSILEEVKDYCSWVDISLDYFLEQASIMVLKKDKEWQDKTKSKK